VQVPRELYPFDGKYLDLDGLRMHYLDEGQGELLVMVHGNPSWSIYYRSLVLGLRDRYRCIVPDHIGCGLSDKPGDDRYPYTLQRRVDDLSALVEHVEAERDVTLIVHDWGGMIGMAWAVQNPDRVKRIVLLNTAAFHLPASKGFPWQLALTRSPVGALLVRGFNAFARGATRQGVTRRPMSRALRDAYCAPYDSWGNRIATLRYVQDIPLSAGDPGYDLVTRVQAGIPALADRPIQICWGDKDFVFDHHFLEVWQQLLPDADVRRFADCGHYILEDAPEEILAQVDQFLTAHPLGQ
jgi:pimeloyl-ACP methyl ester carboxylesterase